MISKLIHELIGIYIILIIIDAVLSYFPDLRYKRPVIMIRKIANAINDPIRKIMPRDLPFDPSPLVAIFALKFFQALW